MDGPFCNKITRKRRDFFEWRGLVHAERRRKFFIRAGDQADQFRQVNVASMHSDGVVKFVNVIAEIQRVVIRRPAEENVEFIRH